MSKPINSEKCRKVRFSLSHDFSFRALNLNILHKARRAVLVSAVFISFLVISEAAMTTPHHGVKDSGQSNEMAARKIGAWSIDTLEYAQGEKMPSECVITQASMRIITDTGRVVSIELDRVPNPDEAGLSSNSRVGFVMIDKDRYWVKRVTSRENTPQNSGISIDDPKTKTYFSHNKSNWRNIVDLAQLLENKRTLRIVGKDGKNISVLQLSRFGEVRALCGF